MAKCVVFDGQSLMSQICNWSSGTLTADSDTHMWTGSGWSAPVGDGALAYLKALRQKLQTPIYGIDVSIGGSALLAYGSNDYWANPAGTMMCGAIAKIQTALASVPGLCLDRIESFRGQTESYTGVYTDMFNSYRTGQLQVIANYRAAFGSGFRFCIWPVTPVHTGEIKHVLRAQMDVANASAAPQDNIEPGPGMYHRGRGSDNLHFGSAAECYWAGIGGARNASSYFEAKANAADSIPHYGAGPVIDNLLRHSNNNTCTMFARIRAKNGHCVIPSSQWSTSDTTKTLNGWAVQWNSGSYTTLQNTVPQLMGGWVKIVNDFPYYYPVRVSYQGERDCGTTLIVQDTNIEFGGDQGQVLLPVALGSMASD